MQDYRDYIEEVTDYICDCRAVKCIENTQLYPLSKKTEPSTSNLPGNFCSHLFARNGRPNHLA